MLPRSLLDAAARSVGGILTFEDAAREGIHQTTVSAWAREGLLEWLAPGHFRIAGAPVSPLQCVALPLRYLEGTAPDPAALVTGEASLAAQDVPGFALPCRSLVLVRHGQRVRPGEVPFGVQQTRQFPARYRRVRDLSLTEPFRALADWAADESVETDQVLQAWFDARNRLRLDLVEAIVVWQALRAHRGARRLLALAAKGRLDVESHGELTTLEQIFQQHPPAPDCQVQLTPRYRADFVYLFAALVLEYYGEREHAGSVDSDGSRGFELRDLGYDVMTITKSVVRRGPAFARHVHQTRLRRERDMLAGRLPRPSLPEQPPRRTPLRTLTPLG